MSRPIARRKKPNMTLFEKLQAFKQVRVDADAAFECAVFFHAQVKEENRQFAQKKKRHINMDTSAVLGTDKFRCMRCVMRNSKTKIPGSQPETNKMRKTHLDEHDMMRVVAKHGKLLVCCTRC